MAKRVVLTLDCPSIRIAHKVVTALAYVTPAPGEELDVMRIKESARQQLRKAGPDAKPGLRGSIEATEALVMLVNRITKDGWPKGNPYSVPEIKAALQAIALEKESNDWLNALSG